MAQKQFEKSMQKDGFHPLHANLFVRYCTTSVRSIPESDFCSIIIFPTSQLILDKSMLFYSNIMLHQVCPDCNKNVQEAV